MKTTEPLIAGDEIRVVAPSQSRRLKSVRQYERAKERLESLGYKVTFSESIDKVLHFNTASAIDRAKDINDAYKDKNVKAILALGGGWSANEVLPLMDWSVVKNNPKPFIGTSDITVLVNAIYAKTGQTGYLGPTYSLIGSMLEWQYTLNNFANAISYKPRLEFSKSKYWRVWGSKVRHTTKTWEVLQPGTAEATLLGGNLGTFYLLQGTEYQPSFDTDFILAIEDDDEAGKFTAREFSRRFESILQLPNVRKNLQGVIIGRFQPDSKVSRADIANIIASKQLGSIPVISGVDFGHTLPMLTLPIGGRIRISADAVANISVVN